MKGSALQYLAYLKIWQLVINCTKYREHKECSVDAQPKILFILKEFNVAPFLTSTQVCVFLKRLSTIIIYFYLVFCSSVIEPLSSWLWVQSLHECVSQGHIGAACMCDSSSARVHDTHVE